MWLRRLALAGWVLALLIEAWLLADLVSGPAIATYGWVGLHALAVSLTALAIGRLSHDLPGVEARGMAVLAGALCLCLPLVGALGSGAALLPGLHAAARKHRAAPWWQVTEPVTLPWHAPRGRTPARADSRGLVEQLRYSPDHAELYRQVLAVGRIRASLSVDALKQAVEHPDERIRLTAFQTLDRQVTRLNQEIQRLEHAASGLSDHEASNTWLQVASNYWELLTLEKDEAVARAQLLRKAARACCRSLAANPLNRNAHFTLGRVSLLQGDGVRASAAFEQAQTLGMPREKVMPFLAEAGFMRRDFVTVARQLGSIDRAFTAYPPLRAVAGYWQ